jgi:DNA/RNA endonuclease G (NUC1)
MSLHLRTRWQPARWLAIAALVACSSDLPTAPRLSPADAPSRDGATTGAPQLVIVELMANPGAVADASGEYVKLYNPGPVDVDLQNYRIQSASGTTIYTGTETVESHTIGSSVPLAVGACVVLGNNVLAAENGGITTERYSYGTRITLGNNTTDWVTIKTPSGVLLDSVAYSAGGVGSDGKRIAVAPTFSAPSGSTRLVIDPSVDHTVMAGTNWQNATTTYGAGDRGTPNDCQYTWRSDGGSQVVGPLDHVVVTGTDNVSVGGTTQLSAAAQDANNRPIASATITWTSENESVATVDASGLVTAVSASAVPVRITATATDNGITKVGTRDVTVTIPEIHWIDATFRSSSFPAGFQTEVFGTARISSGGTIVPATFTFEAEDPEIAAVRTVNGEGIITGISAPTDGTRPGIRITATPTAGGNPYSFVTHSITIEAPTFAPTSIYATNDEFGDPTPASPSNANDQLIARAQYTLSYNQSRGTPNWVSYELDARQMASGQDRCNCFTADPNLPADKQIFTSDYTNGGYDRGHMTRSADRTAANGDNATTFYLTNVVPQMGDLNQGVWAQFENALADSADAGRAVYIITGPLYSSGHALTFLKNEGKVAIPDSTWKIAFIGPRNGGVPFNRAALAGWGDVAGTTVLAVKMPNVAGVRNDPWSKYLTTVDRIEASTGYDFLSLLPTAFQTAIEAGDRSPVAQFSAGGATNEGSTITLDASASSDPDLGSTNLDRPETLSYAWTFSDGTRASGVTASKTFTTYGAYTVTLTVTDAYGWESTSTKTISVANVAPVVASIPGATLLQGETYSAAGSFADPGVDPFSATVSYEGASEPLALTGKTFQLSHMYATAGTFTVIAAVSDGAASGEARATVVVESPAQGIANLSEALASLGGLKAAALTISRNDAEGFLGKGEINSLQVKLNAASAQLDGADRNASANVIGAFVNELNALVTSGRVSSEAAAPIISYAERVIRSLRL